MGRNNPSVILLPLLAPVELHQLIWYHRMDGYKGEFALAEIFRKAKMSR